MKWLSIGLTMTLVAVVALMAESSGRTEIPAAELAALDKAVDKGARWLASVQGTDGGWGQDGGEISNIRTGERLESSGNDVANTAVAAMALRRAGKAYQRNVERALIFILERVESSSVEGLAVTDRQGTQIQRKLGPYIDTFLTSMLLAEVDGTLSNPTLNARVRKALEKCVTKIERNQQKDGSWNIAGGWAPVLGTSLASRSLYEAKQKGLRVEPQVMERAGDYTVKAMNSSDGRVTVSGRLAAAPAESAGVALYQSAQALEQLSRTDEDRRKNAREIDKIRGQMRDARFVEGFGSMGGEEFFSYLNLSDGMKRAGGPEWSRWHTQITQKIMSQQNNDGTWAGHHCITGRVAVTSAAILNLTIHAN